MNCKEATEILDRMIFEEIAEDAGIRKHLDSCVSCSMAYNDAVKAGRILELVRRSEPHLQDPAGLTSAILAMAVKKPVKPSVIPMFLTRLLAAASVALVLLFGYEQYGVVTRISALEKQCAASGPANTFSSLLQSRSLQNIQEAGISLPSLGHLLSRAKEKPLLPASSIIKKSDQKAKK